MSFKIDVNLNEGQILAGYPVDCDSRADRGAKDRASIYSYLFLVEHR